MGDAYEEAQNAEELNLQPLEDDCKLLGTLLEDVLKLDVGEKVYAGLIKIRAMAQAASLLEANGADQEALVLQRRMREAMMEMPLEEALPIVRALGQYLNISGIAELHHRTRTNRIEGVVDTSSVDDCFSMMLAEGVTAEELYHSVVTQAVEIVLTAHPTQVNRRTLQYKHTRIAALLSQHDRSDLTKEERSNNLDDLMREVTGLWQTDELRRQRPTPVDEARGGLHIVEQSLWSAVPAFMRRLSASLKKHTGRDLPLSATPFKFGSWMGGDRDGNPNVTAKTTKHVVYLSRWMAADLYLREVDALRFELSMSSCSRDVWRMARRIICKEQMKATEGVARMARDAARTYGSRVGLFDLHTAASGESASVKPVMLRGGLSRLAHGMRGAVNLPAGAVTGVRPQAFEGLDGMPSIPGLLPGQALEGGSECGFDDEEDDDFDDGSETGFGCDTSNGLSATTPFMSKTGSQVAFPPEALGHELHHMSLKELHRNASVGLSDPTSLRRTLRSQRAQALPQAFRKQFAHPGFHPCRVILGDIRQKLLNTRKRMEDLLAEVEPSADDIWYEDEEELDAPLLAIYWSMYECGSGMLADGRLLDLLRRISCFGMCMTKLDVRQESTRHSEAINAITEYLGYGSYFEWDEQKRIAWLASELQGRRPLIPQDMPMTPEVKEVLDTFKVVAKLARSSLGAYVISMTRGASDVLAVELLQREARAQVAAARGCLLEECETLRVVPLFETLDDLDHGGAVMQTLFDLPWYRQHIAANHDNTHEVMLGYSDSGKDAGRLAANWALYRCQEQLVAVTKAAGVKLTLFHGRGGTVGRGGGPTSLAILSQPPGSVEGSFRITEQGEMVQAKFGISAVALNQLETYTTAVCRATLRPPPPPKQQAWRDRMDSLSVASCEAYREVVYNTPCFLAYFRNATPEAELGNLNIGSRPARRRADNAGIGSLRAIPWQFAWTQTRLILPSWLGVGDSIMAAIQQGHRKELRQMYKEWPFFAATIDLIEMILAKSDARISALYDETLVKDPEQIALGQALRLKLANTCQAVLEVSGHTILLQHNTTLRRLILIRNPFIDPINVMQCEILRRLREDPNNSALRDALLISINGIAAGMRNTG